MATERTEIYAVLMKLAGDTLLLPNSAVVEVVSAERLRAPGPAAPAWLAGRIGYGGREVPVMRFEVMNGGKASGEERRARIAILHTISDALGDGQYGLMCQGYPHLVTLNREALKTEPAEAGDHAELILSRVRIANTAALIPNLELMESELANVETATAATR